MSQPLFGTCSNVPVVDEPCVLRFVQRQHGEGALAQHTGTVSLAVRIVASVWSAMEHEGPALKSLEAVATMATDRAVVAVELGSSIHSAADTR